MGIILADFLAKFQGEKYIWAGILLKNLLKGQKKREIARASSFIWYFCRRHGFAIFGHAAVCFSSCRIEYSIRFCSLFSPYLWNIANKVMNQNQFLRTCNALMALVLMGILMSGFYQQYVRNQVPCPLCILQRMGMIGVAMGNLMNLRFGIKPRHYALSIFCIFFGGTVALKHISLHVCPGFPSFGIPVLGLHLYTWSFISYACSLFAIMLMLFLYTATVEKTKLNSFEKFAFIVVFLMILANLASTLIECGLGVCENL